MLEDRLPGLLLQAGVEPQALQPLAQIRRPGRAVEHVLTRQTQKFRHRFTSRLAAQVIHLALQTIALQQLRLLLGQHPHHSVVIRLIKLQGLAELLKLQQGAGTLQAAGAQHLRHHIAIEPAALLAAQRRHRLDEGEHLLRRQRLQRAAIEGRLKPGQLTQLTPQAFAGALPAVGGLITPPAAVQGDGGSHQHEGAQELSAMGSEQALQGIRKPEEDVDGGERGEQAGVLHGPLSGVVLAKSRVAALDLSLERLEQACGNGRCSREPQGNHQQARQGNRRP